MSTWLGLPGSERELDEPSQCTATEEKIGARRRMASGTLKFDYVAKKKTWRVSWSILPKGGKYNGFTEVYTELTRAGEMHWSPPDEDAKTDGWHTVLATDLEWELVNIEGEECYNISGTLEEV